MTWDSDAAKIFKKGVDIFQCMMYITKCAVKNAA